MKQENWPELSFEKGNETYQTIHLWTQIAGKIKLAKMPWINHSWHTTLIVTPFGLSTGDIPDINKHFQINFDFLKHQLQIITSDKEERVFQLSGMSVASCYSNILSALKDLKIEIKINPIPCEIENAVPFHKDENHSTYVPEVASNFHKALLNVQRVFTEFRAKFTGKCSPVHFFWGSFDFAVSRFSGREAPKHPGGIPNLPDWVAQEAYSHEVYSCGFWPGSKAMPFAAFYSYIYPAPEGFSSASVKPESAYYHKDLGEFILAYKDVQQAQDSSELLTQFLDSTYEAAAGLANWDRTKLENTSYLKFAR
jgi:hypothetical protein